MRRGLRVLYVGSLPPTRGGTEVVGLLLLRGLQTCGVTVSALASLPLSHRDEAMSGPYRDLDSELSVTRYLVPTTSSLLDMGSSDPSYRSVEHDRIAELLPAMLRTACPDVVMIGRESLAWDVPDIALAQGTPTILLVHGGKTLCGLLGGLTNFPASRLREQLHKVDLIVAVAQHIADELRRLGLPRVEFAPNPVDIRAFSPRPARHALREALAIPPDSTVVLHISNLTELKRPLDVVLAAEIASRSAERLIYVVLGDGCLRAALEDRIDGTRLRHQFRFAGWVNHWLVPEYINLADLVVMPSETEGQSLVYLETQACAKVILASDIPAAREVITDGETGLLFRRGDVADLAEKLLFAAARPRLRAAIGVKARASVVSYASHRLLAHAFAQRLRELSGARRLAVV